MIFALGDNASHGLRRSPGDKKKAILAAIAMSKAQGWSQSDIARLCSVHRSYVQRLIPKESESATVADSDNEGAKLPVPPDPPPIPSEPAHVAAPVPDDPPASGPSSAGGSSAVHAYSDDMWAWLQFLGSHAFYVACSQGGIDSVLRQADQWDWLCVEEKILP